MLSAWQQVTVRTHALSMVGNHFLASLNIPAGTLLTWAARGCRIADMKLSWSWFWFCFGCSFKKMLFFNGTAADRAAKLCLQRTSPVPPCDGETGSLRNKTDNKSQILSLNLSAWEDEDAVSTSNCLILIFLFNVSFHLLLFGSGKVLKSCEV